MAATDERRVSRVLRAKDSLVLYDLHLRAELFGRVYLIAWGEGTWFEFIGSEISSGEGMVRSINNKHRILLPSRHRLGLHVCICAPTYHSPAGIVPSAVQKFVYSETNAKISSSCISQLYEF